VSSEEYAKEVSDGALPFCSTIATNLVAVKLTDTLSVEVGVWRRKYAKSDEETLPGTSAPNVTAYSPVFSE
jgi:hypothetical protein